MASPTIPSTSRNPKIQPIRVLVRIKRACYTSAVSTNKIWALETVSENTAVSVSSKELMMRVTLVDWVGLAF